MGGTTPVTYTGSDAVLLIGNASASGTHSDFAIADCSITLDRGTVEQELVGQTGNYFTQGALTVEGSFTHSKFSSDVVNILIGAVVPSAAGVNPIDIYVSGEAGANSLHFYFHSCQITGFDLSFGDASTVTEGSVDFTVINPQDISLTEISGGGTYITD